MIDKDTECRPQQYSMSKQLYICNNILSQSFKVNNYALLQMRVNENVHQIVLLQYHASDTLHNIAIVMFLIGIDCSITFKQQFQNYILYALIVLISNS